MPVRIYGILLCSILTTLLSACDRSDGFSGSRANITFPPNGALVDASMLTVSGTASDRDGVASVSVNGVAATSDDNFATWMAAVPIVRGENTLAVAVTDGAGNESTSTNSVQIINELLSPSLTSPVLDVDNNRLFSIDSFRRSLISVDINNGNREIFSGSGVPDTNVPFISPRGLLLDSENQRLLVLDTGRLLSVELDTGVRSVISDEDSSDGGNLIATFASNMTLDANNNRVLISNFTDFFNPFAPPGPPTVPQLLIVDLTTGERSILSGVGVPNSDSAFNNIGMIATDTLQNQAIVIDRITDSNFETRLLTVDLVNGQRSILSSANQPNNENLLGFPTGLTIDQPNNRALVQEINRDLLAVDLNTGARSVLFEGSPVLVPFGFLGIFSQPNNIAFNQNTGQVFTTNTSADLVEVIDLDTGERDSVTNLSNVPDDVNTLLFPVGVAYDNQNSRLIVLDQGRVLDIDHRLIAVETATGLRTEVLNLPIAPNGVIIQYASEIKFGVNSNLFYTLERGPSFIRIGDPQVIDFAVRLITLDVASGERTVISANDDGQEIEFDFPAGLAVDEDGGIVYVLDQEGILAVDIDTGERSLFAAEPEVSDIPIGFNDFFTGIALDKNNNRLLATNVGRDVVAIDLDTQAQSLFAEALAVDFAVFSSSSIPMTIDSVRNNLVLALNQNIETVDLDNGSRSVLRDDVSANIDTVFSLNPQSITFDPDNDRIVTLDGQLNAVIVIHPETGERAILSR